MTLESLGKMRNYIDDNFSPQCKPWYEGQEIADEIQDEIESRFMPMPLDADGVPIRVGDEMENGEYRGKVTDMSWDGHFWHVYHGSIAIAPCDYTHVKPRTVEDVLLDFLRESRNFNLKRDGEVDEAIAKYAAELRMRDGE